MAKIYFRDPNGIRPPSKKKYIPVTTRYKYGLYGSLLLNLVLLYLKVKH